MGVSSQRRKDLNVQDFKAPMGGLWVKSLDELLDLIHNLIIARFIS
jgi:hypothetical protein